MSPAAGVCPEDTCWTQRPKPEKIFYFNPQWDILQQDPGPRQKFHKQYSLISMWGMLVFPGLFCLILFNSFFCNPVWDPFNDRVPGITEYCVCGGEAKVQTNCKMHSGSIQKKRIIWGSSILLDFSFPGSSMLAMLSLTCLLERFSSGQLNLCVWSSGRLQMWIWNCQHIGSVQLVEMITG